MSTIKDFSLENHRLKQVGVNKLGEFIVQPIIKVTNWQNKIWQISPIC